MIRNKLRSTIKHRDHLPGTWETPINPDGFEAADYIDNMVDHFGYVIRIALANIDDQKIRKQIEKHARMAIKGEKHDVSNGSSQSLQSCARPSERWAIR